MTEIDSQFERIIKQKIFKDDKNFNYFPEELDGRIFFAVEAIEQYIETKCNEMGIKELEKLLPLFPDSKYLKHRIFTLKEKQAKEKE